MHFSGVQEVAADRASVWSRLNDPVTLQQCIPGCERFEEIGLHKYEAVVATSIGLAGFTFKGCVTLSERVANKGYRIDGTGTGGMARLGNFAAYVNLTDSVLGTRLSYTGDAQLDDMLAQAVSYFIQMAASQFAQTFFERFNALVSPRARRLQTQRANVGR